MSDCDITCPFCGEDGFDKPGLAEHVDMYCEEANVARREIREHQRSMAKAALRRARKKRERDPA